MPLFDFTLRPLESVVPWGKPDDPNDRHLSWFGLTDGTYSIDVGQARLFQNTPEILSDFAAKWPDATRFGDCADYQVVRLYEDVLDLLSSIRSPVPESVHRLVCGIDAYRAWRSSLRWACESEGNTDVDELYFAATDWMGYRQLDSMYLIQGPRIWFWSHEGRVWIQWDNEDQVTDGTPRWTATAGTISIPIDTFTLEVESFHNRLMAAMAERISIIERDDPLPDVTIDVPGLKLEHADRELWLDRARQAEVRIDDWDAILTANQRLAKNP